MQRYHNMGGLVAAGRPTIIDRDFHRRRGEELVTLLRSELYDMAHAAKHIPASHRQQFQDVAPNRARAISLSKCGELLSVLQFEPTIPAHRLGLFELRCHGWMSSALPRSTEHSCLRTLYERETMHEATANVSGVRALFAIEHDDVAALDAAIEDHAAHLESLRRLLAQLQFERREMMARRGRRQPYRSMLVGARAQ